MTSKRVSRSSHWDSWGNPTVDYFSMLDYYAKDQESLEVLRKRPPHMYVVIPDIWIRFTMDDPKEVYLSKVYPGGSKEEILCFSEKQYKAMRKMYAKPKPGWKKEVKGRMVIYHFTGRLYALKFSKFGIQ